MNSRLDRLFVLLETGSNESIRLAAAKQLGEVQKAQPNDLEYLLGRIKEYSRKSNWDARVAAGHALRCVLEHVEPWPQLSRNFDLKDDKGLLERHAQADRLVESVDVPNILRNFDLDRIVSSCPLLLSTSAAETDDNLDQGGQSSTRGGKGKGRGRKDSSSTARGRKEQLLRQKHLINKELGLSIESSLGIKSTEIVSNDDLQTDFSTDGRLDSTGDDAHQQQDTRTIIRDIIANYDRIVQTLSDPKLLSQSKSEEPDKVDKHRNKWPLQDVLENYMDDLFDSSWEVRHGAAIALREIVRLHGKSAGKRSDIVTTKLNDRLNQIWLADAALKSICTLTLDKFGDFLFDQVVAPVRENAAQLLGCCVASMCETDATLIIQLLLKMLHSPNWETRHGGILGLKYSLNVLEQRFLKGTLPMCFDSIFKCLGDTNDDVSAEAAASLVPVKDIIIDVIPEKAPKLIGFLWDHLGQLDELTTSTSNIVQLLASLITSSAAPVEPSELTRSIPRLWPILEHSSTVVRLSALKALDSLLRTQEDSCLSWFSEDLITQAMQLVFQRSILENFDEARPHLESVWMQLIRLDVEKSSANEQELSLLKSTSQFLNYWLCLTMQTLNLPIDRSNPMWLNISPDGSKSITRPEGEVYIGSCTFNAETIDSQKAQAVKCRLLGTKLLGALYATLTRGVEESQHAPETLKYLSDMFVHYLRTKSANQRMLSGWALDAWASFQARNMQVSDRAEKLPVFLTEVLIEQLGSALQETSLCYDELAPDYTRLQQEARDFVATLASAGVNYPANLASSSDKRAIYNLNQIQSMCDLDLETELSETAPKRHVPFEKISPTVNPTGILSTLISKRTNLLQSLQSTKKKQKTASTSVLSSLASAQISWRLLPSRKIHLLSNPLLDSIETEGELSLQDKSIAHLLTLLDILSRDCDQNASLINDILNRMTNALHQTRSSLISAVATTTAQNGDENVMERREDEEQHCRIVLLDNLQRRASEQSRSVSRRQSSVNRLSSLKRSHPSTSSTDLELSQDEITSDSASEAKLRSMTNALNKVVGHFGTELPERLPTLWTMITSNIRLLAKQYFESTQEAQGKDCPENLMKSLSVLQAVGKSLDTNLQAEILSLFENLICLLSSTEPLLRHRSAQCIGMIAKLMFNQTATMITCKILPMLDTSDQVVSRCGAIEAIALIIEQLQIDLVPRINLFIVHILKRMSDQNDQVRLMATHCFGKLLSLMPLSNEKPDSLNEVRPKEVKQEGESSRTEELSFIEQLLNPKKLSNYEMPFDLSTELRSYQQDGLNWLAFLNQFNLNGILCDEMGLGKTLMTICMVASDHYKQSQPNRSDAACKRNVSPSLIVCPPTLIEHWLYEIVKFVPSETRQSVLNPIAYSGTANERVSLKQAIGSLPSPENGACSNQQRVNLVVTSYDVVRNDIDYLKSINWNYCVLDEGHIIKNCKTKLSKAIRLLTAKHRLILSGTPIQNNVVELWSLFDFLMPGFLGSERQFTARYARPIIQSRELKCSPRDLEVGALAMESLHRQVLPFILRRRKEDVLDDLPPKIIQDYYCELSPLQLKLYEDFTKSKLCDEVTKKSLDALKDEESAQSTELKTKSKGHVFQALQYLRNVCNHPKLVLTAKHCHYSEIKKQLDKEKSCLDDITHSSKLNALKQLLIDCGIGATATNLAGEELAAPVTQQATLEIETVVKPHRALVFCQHRSMVDIVENDLIRKHLSTVTFLRLDGSVPLNQRQSIVERFNNDPSIDLLLLTTQIGGLGLNLTGADTVIFVEHDWNPTKDLQAMDRAHRIGQKKVVNVYRLITKGTLEEKIMGLQKFKLMVSNTVINADNTSLGTMQVDQLFDLFAAGDASSDKTATAAASKSSSSFMDLLPELWGQEEYEAEYDLSNFVSSLRR